MYDTSILSGTVHSNRTVAVLLHKQILLISDCWHFKLSIHLAHSLILAALSQTVGILLQARLTLQQMSTLCSLFSSRLITSNFSSILIFFHRLFTWSAQVM